MTNHHRDQKKKETQTRQRDTGGDGFEAPRRMSCRETPTCLDDDGHGGLLDDGAYPREGGEAAVVPAAVPLHGVGEVEVPVQAHGHPLVLFDVLEI